MMKEIGRSIFSVGKTATVGSKGQGVEAGGGRGIWGNNGKQAIQSSIVCAAQGASKRW